LLCEGAGKCEKGQQTLVEKMCSDLWDVIRRHH